MREVPASIPSTGNLQFLCTQPKVSNFQSFGRIYWWKEPYRQRNRTTKRLSVAVRCCVANLQFPIVSIYLQHLRLHRQSSLIIRWDCSQVLTYLIKKTGDIRLSLHASEHIVGITFVMEPKKLGTVFFKVYIVIMKNIYLLVTKLDLFFL